MGTNGGVTQRTSHVAFGYYPGWLEGIAARIDRDRYQPAFAPLDAVDPDRFDALLPLRIDHYVELAALGASAAAKSIVPEAAVVALCDDKLALALRLGDVGFGRHIPPIIDQPTASSACIRKPRRGEFGKGCAIVDGANQDDWSADPNFFLQALVPGKEEYALHILRHRGEVRYTQGVRYGMNGPCDIRSAATKPISVAFVDCAPLIGLFDRMLDAIGFDGTCCVNFKLAGDTPMVLEINPRFGASLVFDINRYVDAYIRALAAS